ncbi:DUF2336 domain-containing protein [Methylobacterium nigriterrae]|uniref:DUF2336 domain-containing protein n=1 Tax=Methylobacterium nigriterrae TaxID=3127512 RepID=UPI00301337AB
MSMHSSGPDRLETLLAGLARETYASAALKLAEQFEGGLSETEARVYDEALLRLARAERTKVRVHLSQRLAPVEAGPVRTVTDLAYDLDPDIAAPVLRRSVLLEDADLVRIAQTRGQRHLGALAERQAVSAPVTDVVVARGSWPVLRQLAANRTAELSGTGLSRLVALSRSDGHITVALTKRSDVPAAAKRELQAQFRDMATAQRASLRGEHSDIRLDREVPHAVSASPTSAPVRQASTDPLSAERLRSAAVRVGVLAQSRSLTRAEVSDALARGRLAEAVVIIARLADEEPETFVQALRGLSPVKNLALLVMRSADLNWTTVERLLREVGSVADREGKLPALNVAGQREAYVGLSSQAAQRALQAVRLRAGLTVIAGGRSAAD